MIRMDVSEAQRREVPQLSRQAVGRVALRAQMVLRCARGYRVPRSAAVHDCEEEVVRWWLHRYAAAGIAGLADAPRSGRPPKDRLAAAIVATQARHSPACAGPARSFWPVATWTALLCSRCRLVRSRERVRRSRNARGWRWARPRLAPARTLDPAQAATRAALATAAQAVAAGQGHLR
jgi:transposase